MCRIDFCHAALDAKIKHLSDHFQDIVALYGCTSFNNALQQFINVFAFYIVQIDVPNVGEYVNGQNTLIFFVYPRRVRCSGVFLQIACCEIGDGLAFKFQVNTTFLGRMEVSSVFSRYSE